MVASSGQQPPFELSELLFRGGEALGHPRGSSPSAGGVHKVFVSPAVSLIRTEGYVYQNSQVIGGPPLNRYLGGQDHFTTYHPVTGSYVLQATEGYASPLSGAF